MNASNPKRSAYPYPPQKCNTRYTETWGCGILQWLQTALWERHKRRTIRRTLEDVSTSGRLDENGNLLVADIPVSVVYYRAGYAPGDYESSTGQQSRDKWQARWEPGYDSSSIARASTQP